MTNLRNRTLINEYGYFAHVLYFCLNGDLIMYTILGFSKFISRNKKPCCTIQLAQEFSDFEKKNGSIGMKVVKRRDGSDLFLPDNLMDIVDESNVGAKCDVLFSETGALFDIRIL